MEGLRENDMVTIQGHEGIFIVVDGEFARYEMKIAKSVKTDNKPAYARLAGSKHYGSGK